MRSDARSRAVRTASLAGRSEVYSSRSLRPNLSEAVNAWIASPWSTASCCGRTADRTRRKPKPTGPMIWRDLLSAVIPNAASARIQPYVEAAKRAGMPETSASVRRLAAQILEAVQGPCRTTHCSASTISVQRLRCRAASENPDAERRAAAPSCRPRRCAGGRQAAWRSAIGWRRNSRMPLTAAVLGTTISRSSGMPIFSMRSARCWFRSRNRRCRRTKCRNRRSERSHEP